MFHKMQPEWSQSASSSFFTLRSALIKVVNDNAVYSHSLALGQSAAFDDLERFKRPRFGAN